MRVNRLTVALIVVVAVGIGGTYGFFVWVSDPAAEDDIDDLGTETVVSEGDVEADTTAVLQAVAGLRGYEAPTPAEVSVREATGGGTGLLRFRVLGMDTTLAPRLVAFRWEVSGLGDATVALAETLDRTGQRVALAGAAERVHQREREVGPVNPLERTDRFRDYDASWAARLVTRGAATYVERTYWREQGEPGRDPMSFYRAQATRSDAAHRATAAHRLGYEWVDERVTAPTELDAVYADAPTRTSTILHPAGAENRTYPPVNVTATGSDWAPDTRVRLGELVSRFALETELTHEAASRAAAGWTDDRLVEFLGGADERGYVWAVRLRNGTEADEFATLARTYLGARGEAVDGTTDRWRGDLRDYGLVRAGPETVVMLFGPPGFLEGVDVRGDGAGNVTVAS